MFRKFSCLAIFSSQFSGNPNFRFIAAFNFAILFGQLGLPNVQLSVLQFAALPEFSNVSHALHTFRPSFPTSSPLPKFRGPSFLLTFLPAQLFTAQPFASRICSVLRDKRYSQARAQGIKAHVGWPSRTSAIPRAFYGLFGRAAPPIQMFRLQEPVKCNDM